MPSIFKNEVVKIACYFIGAIALGALLTPPLFWLGQSVVQSGVLKGNEFLGINLHEEIERAGLGRFFNRAMLLSALLCLWPTIRWLGVKPRDFLRLKSNPHRLRHFLFGFLVAGLGMVVTGWILLATGVFAVEKDADSLWKIAGAWIISALVVAFLEEFFFRGCLLGLTRRTMGWIGSLIFVSAIFSAVHFLKPPSNFTLTVPREISATAGSETVQIPAGTKLRASKPFTKQNWATESGQRVDLAPEDREILGPLETVRWHTGFWLAGQVFVKFGDPRFILAEFATLFLIGWVLGYARLRTDSLWLAIGLHAGWILTYESYRELTEKVKLDTQPWVGEDLKSGLVALLMVGLTGILVWAWLKWTWPPKSRPGR